MHEPCTDTWDTSITTLPGTYMVSLLFFRLFWWLPGTSSSCTVSFLRYTSSIALSGIGAVVYLWARQRARAGQAWPSGQPSTMTTWAGGVPVTPVSVQSSDECSIQRPRLTGALSASYLSWMASPWVWPALMATCIVSFPPLWFSGHLYYTDTAGLLFVLAAYATAPMNTVPAFEVASANPWRALASASVRPLHKLP
jgi:hypothetical protein